MWHQQDESASEDANPKDTIRQLGQPEQHDRRMLTEELHAENISYTTPQSQQLTTPQRTSNINANTKDATYGDEDPNVIAKLKHIINSPNASNELKSRVHAALKAAELKAAEQNAINNIDKEAEELMAMLSTANTSDNQHPISATTIPTNVKDDDKLNQLYQNKIDGNNNMNHLQTNFNESTSAMLQSYRDLEDKYVGASDLSISRKAMLDFLNKRTDKLLFSLTLKGNPTTKAITFQHFVQQVLHQLTTAIHIAIPNNIILEQMKKEITQLQALLCDPHGKTNEAITLERKAPDLKRYLTLILGSIIEISNDVTYSKYIREAKPIQLLIALARRYAKTKATNISLATNKYNNAKAGREETLIEFWQRLKSLAQLIEENGGTSPSNDDIKYKYMMETELGTRVQTLVATYDLYDELQFEEQLARIDMMLDQEKRKTYGNKVMKVMSPYDLGLKCSDDEDYDEEEEFAQVLDKCQKWQEKVCAMAEHQQRPCYAYEERDKKCRFPYGSNEKKEAKAAGMSNCAYFHCKERENTVDPNTRRTIPSNSEHIKSLSLPATTKSKLEAIKEQFRYGGNIMSINESDVEGEMMGCINQLSGNSLTEVDTHDTESSEHENNEDDYKVSNKNQRDIFAKLISAKYESRKNVRLQYPSKSSLIYEKNNSRSNIWINTYGIYSDPWLEEAGKLNILFEKSVYISSIIKEYINHQTLLQQRIFDEYEIIHKSSEGYTYDDEYDDEYDEYEVVNDDEVKEHEYNKANSLAKAFINEFEAFINEHDEVKVTPKQLPKCHTSSTNPYELLQPHESNNNNNNTDDKMEDDTNNIKAKKRTRKKFQSKAVLKKKEVYKQHTKIKSFNKDWQYNYPIIIKYIKQNNIYYASNIHRISNRNKSKKKNMHKRKNKWKKFKNHQYETTTNNEKELPTFNPLKQIKDKLLQQVRKCFHWLENKGHACSKKLMMKMRMKNNADRVHDNDEDNEINTKYNDDDKIETYAKIKAEANDSNNINLMNVNTNDIFNPKTITTNTTRKKKKKQKKKKKKLRICSRYCKNNSYRRRNQEKNTTSKYTKKCLEVKIAQQQVPLKLNRLSFYNTQSTRMDVSSEEDDRIHGHIYKIEDEDGLSADIQEISEHGGVNETMIDTGATSSITNDENDIVIDEHTTVYTKGQRFYRTAGNTPLHVLASGFQYRILKDENEENVIIKTKVYYTPAAPECLMSWQPLEEEGAILTLSQNYNNVQLIDTAGRKRNVPLKKNPTIKQTGVYLEYNEVKDQDAPEVILKMYEEMLRRGSKRMDYATYKCKHNTDDDYKVEHNGMKIQMAEETVEKWQRIKIDAKHYKYACNKCHHEYYSKGEILSHAQICNGVRRHEQTPSPEQQEHEDDEEHEMTDQQYDVSVSQNEENDNQEKEEERELEEECELEDEENDAANNEILINPKSKQQQSKHENRYIDYADLHVRTGHTARKRLMQAIKAEVYDCSLLKEKEETLSTEECITCKLKNAKSRTETMGPAYQPAKAAGDVIHLDLHNLKGVAQTKEEQIGGFKSSIFVVDDFSTIERHILTTSEDTDAVADAIRWWIRRFNKVPQRIYTDAGSAFSTERLQIQFPTINILSSGDKIQHNGINEGSWRWNKARFQAGINDLHKHGIEVPKVMIGYAMRQASYARDIIPIERKNLKGETVLTTPYELMFNSKPNPMSNRYIPFMSTVIVRQEKSKTFTNGKMAYFMGLDEGRNADGLIYDMQHDRGSGNSYQRGLFHKQVLSVHGWKKIKETKVFSSYEKSGNPCTHDETKIIQDSISFRSKQVQEYIQRVEEIEKEVGDLSMQELEEVWLDQITDKYGVDDGSNISEEEQMLQMFQFNEKDEFIFDDEKRETLNSNIIEDISDIKFLKMSSSQMNMERINAIKEMKIPIQEYLARENVTKLKQIRMTRPQDKMAFIKAFAKELNAMSKMKLVRKMTTTERLKDKLYRRKALSLVDTIRVKEKLPGETEGRIKVRCAIDGSREMTKLPWMATYSPSATMDGIRTQIAMSAKMGLHIMRSADVCNAYRNTPIKRYVLVNMGKIFQDEALWNEVKELLEEPELFDEIMVVLKCFEGLSDSGKHWWESISKFMMEDMNMEQCPDQPCLFKTTNDQNEITLLCSLVVDDLFLTANSIDEIEKFQKKLKEKWDITTQEGDLLKFNGLTIEKSTEGEGYYAICQTDKINEDVQDEIGQDPALTYPLPENTTFPKSECPQSEEERRNLNLEFPQMRRFKSSVAKLMYYSLSTRPEIAAAVNKLSRVTNNPSKKAINGLNHVWRYLKGTSDYKLKYSFTNEDDEIHAYSDSSLGDDVDTRRSSYGYIIMLMGAPVAWTATVMKSVAINVVEAEYFSASEAVRRSIHIMRLCQWIDTKYHSSFYSHQDNQTAILMSNTLWTTPTSRHIDIRSHFIREKVGEGMVKTRYVKTSNNIADIMTKFLQGNTFNRLMEMIYKDFS